MAAKFSEEPPAGVAVREATPSALTGLLNVLDGAALATDFARIEQRVRDGDALVAVADRGAEDAEGASTGDAGADRATDAQRDATVLGALVLDGDEILAVGVRRRRRGQGIGSALVAAAFTRRDRLVAEFDADVRPFYESLGFAIEAADESGRCRGRLDAAADRR